MRDIPYGETRSYGELARALSSSPRAIGRANATNPVAIVVPCHRVIGNDGSLTGYAGGITRKQTINGEVVVYDLQPGNTLRVHPGHVGMYQESVQFNITTVPGIKNALFGGDGIFLAALTGPGRVWLQSMSMSHLAHAIQEYMPGR